MARVCHCTNQCPACGACCAAGCEHRGSAKAVVTTTSTATIDSWLMQQVRQVVRDEIAKAFEAQQTETRRENLYREARRHRGG